MQTSSSSLRTALRYCGSGRYFSTESIGFVFGLVEVLSTVIMAECLGSIVGRSFLEIDCQHLLENRVTLLMVGKVDMMRCRWCWSMLVGNSSMLRKSKVWTSRNEGNLVTMINISCFWDGGMGRWGRCFINEGGWWLAKVGCRASLVVG